MLLLRALARKVLQEAGYVILEAANRREGLEIAKSCLHAPALVLTDVVMPEMSGPDSLSSFLKNGRDCRSYLLPAIPIMRSWHAVPCGRIRPFCRNRTHRDLCSRQVAAVLNRTGRPTVLVVDDDTKIRQLTACDVRRGRYAVIEAVDGQEGMKQIATRPIKVVVTDLVMPGQEGIETIRELRRNYPEVKILAISGAFGGGSYLKLASHLGADAVLSKPFERSRCHKPTINYFVDSGLKRTVSE